MYSRTFGIVRRFQFDKMFVYFLILATSLVVATSATDIVHPISPENWPAHADFDAMNMIEVQEKAESHLQEFYKANPTYSDLTIFQQPPYVKHLMFTRDAAEHNHERATRVHHRCQSRKPEHATAAGLGRLALGLSTQ